MESKLYVGSLPYTVTDEELGKMFAEAGTVVSARVIIDRDMNRSKGFGFVEMSSEAEAQNAIKMLNGKDMDGRALVVNIAKPMVDRGNQSGGRSNY